MKTKILFLSMVTLVCLGAGHAVAGEVFHCSKTEGGTLDELVVYRTEEGGYEFLAKGECDLGSGNCEYQRSGSLDSDRSRYFNADGVSIIFYCGVRDYLDSNSRVSVKFMPHDCVYTRD